MGLKTLNDYSYFSIEDILSSSEIIKLPYSVRILLENMIRVHNFNIGTQDDIKNVVVNLLKFFNDESCGQCTPCRVGTEKAVKLLEKNIWDEDLLRDLVDTMGEASICGLGQAAGNPITCSLNYFKERL